VSCAKTAEPFEMPFTMCTRVRPGKHVLDRGSHWRHLAIVIEPSMCGSDAAFFGSRPSDHYFRSVCLFVCLFVCVFVCLFVCAEFFLAVFDPISIKLGHMLYVWV